MTLWTVPGTGFAELLINAGDGPTMVINRDEVTQLYVGDDNSVASKNGTGDIDIIDPLSYIVYDGIKSKYGISATPGIPIQVDCVKGATNWAPSPAQAAFQISLLGLATSSNQQTQITQETLTATNTTGVAKDSSLGTVNFNLSAGVIPNQNIANALAAAFGSSTLPVALNPNPYVTNPANGNADITGWGSFQASIATAGLGSANTVPVGSVVNAVKVTPAGGFARANVNTAQMPVVPGQLVQAAFLVWIPTAGTYDINIEFDWTVNGSFAGNTNGPSIIKAPAGWQIISETITAPSNIAGMNGVYISLDYVLDAGGNLPVTDIIYVGFGILDSNVPGSHAGRHANAIAQTGVPLLAFSNTLTASTTTTVALNSSVTDGPYAISQPNYELYISSRYTIAAPGGSPGYIQLTWTDSASGLILDQEIYYYQPGASTGNAHILTIRGITKANTVTVKYGNLDALSAISITRAFFQNSRILERNICKTLQAPTMFAASTYFSAFGDPSSNVILDYDVASFPANNTEFVIGSMYNGDVNLNMDTGAAANWFTVQVFDIVEAQLANQAPIFQGKQDANGNLNTYISLPRRQCVYVVKNTDTVNAHSLQMKVIAREEGS